MINVTELRSGILFTENNDIFAVLSYEHVKTGRGSGNIKVKVRNVRTGAQYEKSFQTGARVQEVDTEKRKGAYLYMSDDNVVFMDNETYDQFEVPKKLLGDQVHFLQEGMPATIQLAHGDPLTIDLPNTAEFVVTEAGASTRGNSVSNVWKKAMLENGSQVDVPLFIKDGDKVRVDTRTGQYIERVK